MGEPVPRTLSSNIRHRAKPRTARRTPSQAPARLRPNRQATDPQPETLATGSAVPYDSLGVVHNRRVHLDLHGLGTTSGTWTAELEGTEELVSGGSGNVSFDQIRRGPVTSRIRRRGGPVELPTFQADPGDVAGTSPSQLDLGQPGCAERPDPVRRQGGSLQSQADGYGTGRLNDYNIDQSGRVSSYLDDTLQTLANGRIGIARFNNAGNQVAAQEDNTFHERQLGDTREHGSSATVPARTSISPACSKVGRRSGPGVHRSGGGPAGVPGQQPGDIDGRPGSRGTGRYTVTNVKSP